MAHVALSAQQRTQLGNGPSRRLRREGMVPGIIYQAGDPSLTLAVNARELRRALADGGRSGVIDLTVTGDAARPVLIKDWQLDPVRGDLTHIDFQEVDLSQAVVTTVPLVLTGTPIGVREGGVLDQTMREIEVSALPDALPEHIELDVTDLEVNASVFVSEVSAPSGVTITSESDLLVASVVPPSTEPVADADAAGDGEGEAEGE
ncbi:MAG TPA: 50S ribosomal protein L25 [Miltoncostaeaceae bacterium]|nr:50S ribosomal protein L25 [Miltoncostaeaceae bacterium]